MSLRATLAPIVVAAIAVWAGGCGDDGGSVSGTLPDVPDSIQLTGAVREGKPIPKQFTCDGKDVSPLLEWGAFPAKAKAGALVLEDPDAPGGTYVHWLAFNFPASLKIAPTGFGPAGAKLGRNSAGKAAYTGPCPPAGEKPHRYVFGVYALKVPLKLGEGAAPEIVRQGIRDQAIARGQLTATYGR